MGYCVSMDIGGLTIPHDKVQDCLVAINNMFTGEKRSYSWVAKPVGGYDSLEEAFDAWRYEC